MATLYYFFFPARQVGGAELTPGAKVVGLCPLFECFCFIFWIFICVYVHICMMSVCMYTCENACCGTHVEVRGPYEARDLTYAFFDTGGLFAVGHCIHWKACARLADLCISSGTLWSPLPTTR